MLALFPSTNPDRHCIHVSLTCPHLGNLNTFSLPVITTLWCCSHTSNLQIQPLRNHSHAYYVFIYRYLGRRIVFLYINNDWTGMRNIQFIVVFSCASVWTGIVCTLNFSKTHIFQVVKHTLRVQPSIHEHNLLKYMWHSCFMWIKCKYTVSCGIISILKIIY